MSRITRSGPDWLAPMTDFQREKAEAPFAVEKSSLASGVVWALFIGAVFAVAVFWL